MIGFLYTIRKFKFNNLTSEQINIINNIDFQKKQKYNLRKMIYEYINLNLPLSYLKDNWSKISSLGKDSSSLHSFIIKYGEDVGLKKFKEKCKLSAVYKNDIIEKYGEIEGKRMLSSRGASLENYINRHGEEQGKIKWDNYLEKRALAYKKKHEDGFKFAKLDRNYYCNLYGSSEGNKRFDKNLVRMKYQSTKKFFINKYGEIDGPIKCRECKDHASLKFFINKYGEDIGRVEYIKKQKKSRNSSRNTYSKWSIDVILELKNVINDLYYFGDNELIIYSGDFNLLHQQIVCPDLFYKGKIIEFQGDLFHANPNIFSEFDCPHPYQRNLMAKEIWQNDKNRILFYKSKGYQTLEIWNLSWVENKNEVLHTCLRFLQKN